MTVRRMIAAGARAAHDGSRAVVAVFLVELSFSLTFTLGWPGQDL